MGVKLRKATPTLGSEPPAGEPRGAPGVLECIAEERTGPAAPAGRGARRESQVPAHELETWKRIFLERGARGLRIRGEPEERELTLARAKIGELMMKLELAEHLIEKRGLTDEWKRHKR